MLPPMHCPFCQADKDRLKVIDSRSCEDGRAIRRRRVCGGCQKRFTTHERVEVAPKLIVVKGNGTREPWDRGKIIAGLERAAFKLDVSPEQLAAVAEAVEDEALRNHDKEVPSVWVGRHVAEKLHPVSEVAYVRFASVYKRFKTSEQFLEEAKSAIALRPDEDAQQQGLFAEGDLTPPPPVVTKPKPAARTSRRPAASKDKPPTARRRRVGK